MLFHPRCAPSKMGIQLRREFSGSVAKVYCSDRTFEFPAQFGA